MIISTIANKKYQRYVPWFVFFATKSYPEYKVKIYLTETIDSIYKKAFEFVKTDKVQYIKNAFKGYPKSNQELKTLLFFTRENENNYMAGDVDVLICRERPSLEQYHVNICKETNMVYNCYFRFGTKKMITGAHFTTPEYSKIIKPVIQKYQKLHLQEKLGLKSGMRNEHILHNMLIEAGFETLPMQLSILHGFHLGIWRGRKIASPRYIHISPLYHLYWYDFFLFQEKSFEYQRLYKMLPLYEISRMKINMEKYLNTIK